MFKDLLNQVFNQKMTGPIGGFMMCDVNVLSGLPKPLERILRFVAVCFGGCSPMFLSFRWCRISSTVFLAQGALLKSLCR